MKTLRWAWRGIVYVALPIAAAEVIASPFFIAGTFGLREAHRAFNLTPGMLAYALAYYCWYYPYDTAVRHWAVITGGGALAVVPLTIGAMASSFSRARNRRLVAQGNPLAEVPEPQRARSSVHGKARWLEVGEAARLYPKPDPDLGGIPIVELNRVSLGRPFNPRDKTTWGKGGTVPMLVDPLEPGRIASGVIIGASGIGKTASFTIPALHAYRGSMVVNDPSGEASAITAAWREEMGHRVAIIDPGFPALGAMNILRSIDIEDKLAPIQIKAFVTEASGPSKPGASKEDSFFKTKGLALNTALLADLLYDPSAEKTVREWRRRIVTPEREMKSRLQSIYAHTRSAYARDVAGELMDTFHETMSGIRSHSVSDTDFLSLGPLADLLSEDTFDPAELCRGKMTVFMQFPSHMLEADPSVARVVLGSLMRTVMKARGRVASSVPFIVEEAYQLKRLQAMAVCRDEGRKFGIPIFSCWQSEGQIEEIWQATGKKAWFNSAAWRMYMGGVDDPATAKELSTSCGTYTVLVPSQGNSNSILAGISNQQGRTRGTNAGLSLAPRRLVTDDELRTSFRTDEALVLFRGQSPGRFGIPLWFRRPNMAADLKPNPFLQEVTSAC